MAAGTALQVTSGSGPYLALGATYAESGKTVADQKVIEGQPYLPVYSVQSQSVALSVGGLFLALMAGASLNVRVLRITLQQVNAASATKYLTIDCLRLTSAGTGGTILTVVPNDTTDPAAGATARAFQTGGTTAGFAGPMRMRLPISTAPGAGNSVTWTALTFAKGIIIPAGTANGLGVFLETTDTTATGDALFEFIETPF